MVINSTINTVNRILTNYHMIEYVVDCVVRVAVTAHEDVDSSVVVFRPSMDGDMGFCESNHTCYTLSLVELVKVAMKNLSSCELGALLQDTLKKVLVF